MTAAPGWWTDPVESGAAAGFGVYLHVPFCAHRCGYCDFATYGLGTTALADDDGMRRYVAALRTDLARTVAAGPAAAAPRGAEVPDRWPAVTSVFVGGGTPTLLPPHDLAGLIRAVRDELDVAAAAEVTVECNPETATPELFTALVDAGVTRLSMGAQSFAPHVLTTLERRHGAERPVAAVRLAREAGIAEVNLDLIYGTPGETAADWADTLHRAVAAGTDHLSAYALTVHANTPFGARVRAGTMPPVDGDVQRERFEVARAVLGTAGFDHYELSNWARTPRRRSDHNVLYWRHGDYLGLGVGAHGHLAGRRWWSTRSLERYLEAVEAGASPVAADEVTTDGERAAERLLLGLRLREGIHPRDLPPLDAEALADAVAAGLVATTCGRLRATPQGWFLLDEAVARLV